MYVLMNKAFVYSFSVCLMPREVLCIVVLWVFQEILVSCDSRPSQMGHFPGGVSISYSVPKLILGCTPQIPYYFGYYIILLYYIDYSWNTPDHIGLYSTILLHTCHWLLLVQPNVLLLSHVVPWASAKSAPTSGDGGTTTTTKSFNRIKEFKIPNNLH